MPNFEGGTGSGGGGTGDITREQVQDDMIFDLTGALVIVGDGQILFAMP
jgi:hypothetical protein